MGNSDRQEGRDYQGNPEVLRRSRNDLVGWPCSHCVHLGPDRLEHRQSHQRNAASPPGGRTCGPQTARCVARSSCACTEEAAPDAQLAVDPRSPLELARKPSFSELRQAARVFVLFPGLASVACAAWLRLELSRASSDRFTLFLYFPRC